MSTAEVDLEDRFGWLGRPAPVRVMTERHGQQVWARTAISRDHYIEGPPTIIEETEARTRDLLVEAGATVEGLRWDAIVEGGGVFTYGCVHAEWSPGEPLPDNLVELRCWALGDAP